MSPPPPHGGEANAFEEVRRDHTTRRLVTGFQEQLGEVREEVSSLSHGLASLRESAITHKALLAWAGGFALTIIGCVWMLLGRLEQATETKLAATESTISDVKDEGKKDTAEVRRDVRDLYRAVLTRKRQERLEQPIAEETP